MRRFARGLQDLGLKKGQRVGLFLPNCPYFLVAYYGILRAGGTVVNYNPLYARDEVRHQINDSETDIMITADLKILAETVIDMLHETRLNEVIIADFTDMLPFPKNHLFKLLKGSQRLKVNYADKRLTKFKDMLAESGEPDDIQITNITKKERTKKERRRKTVGNKSSEGIPGGLSERAFAGGRVTKKERH